MIVCELETAVHSESLVYDALSYSWGDWGKEEHTISVSGQALPVTPNLFAALHQLRDDGYSAKIWVDAVCINQKDSDEKASQLPMMRQLYAFAATVVVWLGVAADDSDDIIDFLNLIGPRAFDAGVLTIDSALRTVMFDPDPDERRAAIETAVRALSDEIGFDFPFIARKALTERGYWRRAWIVQEMVLARKIVIVCGSKKINYDFFAAAGLFLDIHSLLSVKNVQNWNPDDFFHPVTGPALMQKVTSYFNTSPSPAPSYLVGVRKNFQNRTGPPLTLFDLLTRGCIVASQISQRQATNPKDMIYGTMGLAADAEELNLVFDYRDSTTAAQVYTSVARAFLERGHADVLAWCQPTREQPHLPSWVPDFSALIREPCGETKKAALFRASGDTAIDCLPPDPSRLSHLSIRGIRIDRIAALGPEWLAPLTATSFDMPAAAALFTSIEAFCAQSQARAVPMPADAAARIACADQGHDPRGDRVRVATAAAAAGYADLKARTQVAALQSDEGGAFQRAMDYMHDRRSALLEMGYVGLVPALSRPGDVVCVVLGAHVPFVLREREGGDGGLWELVGEAYVYGIMDGEALQAEHTTEIFTLS